MEHTGAAAMGVWCRWLLAWAPRDALEGENGKMTCKYSTTQVEGGMASNLNWSGDACRSDPRPGDMQSIQPAHE